MKTSKPILESFEYLRVIDFFLVQSKQKIPLKLSFFWEFESIGRGEFAEVVASGFVGIFAARPLLARLQVKKSRERGLAIGGVTGELLPLRF